MLLEMIQGIPAWAIGPACVLGFVVPAMIGLWLVQRGIHERLRVGETLIDNGVVGLFFSGILTIYGITLGLIAVSTWESSRRSNSYALTGRPTVASGSGPRRQWIRRCCRAGSTRYSDGVYT